MPEGGFALASARAERELGDNTMRTCFPANLHNQTTSIEGIVFPLQCRHELIPILVALQHIYQNEDLRQEILELIAAYALTWRVMKVRAQERMGNASER